MIHNKNMLTCQSPSEVRSLSSSPLNPKEPFLNPRTCGSQRQQRRELWKRQFSGLTPTPNQGLGGGDIPRGRLGMSFNFLVPLPLRTVPHTL